MHFSSFCLSRSSVADFSNTEARAPTSAGRAPCLPARRAMRFMYVVCVWVMVIFRWLFLFSFISFLSLSHHIYIYIYIYIYNERERMIMWYCSYRNKLNSKGRRQIMNEAGYVLLTLNY